MQMAAKDGLIAIELCHMFIVKCQVLQYCYYTL